MPARHSRSVWLRAILALLTAVGATACSQLLSDPSRYGEVNVLVARFNGDPIEGAQITLYTGDRPVQYARTGPDGRYTFREVPFGLYGVALFAPAGYELPENVVGGERSNIVQGLEIRADSVLPLLKFRLFRAGPGAVFVLAQDTAGRPVSGIQTSLYNANAVLQRGITGSDGRVTFIDVPLGTYGVNLRRLRGYYDFGEDPFLAIDKQVIESGTADTIKVTLRRCQGAVRARVRDDKGKPVARIVARLYSGDGPYGDVLTDSLGIATFPTVDCGEYGVLLAPLFGYLSSLKRGEGFIDGIAVSRGAPIASPIFTLRTDNCGAAIRARAVDGAGTPVPGATIKLYTGVGDYRDGLTDANGFVVFDQLPCSAEYGVKVVPPAGYFVTAGRGTSFYDAIQPSGADVVFTLRKG